MAKSALVPVSFHGTTLYAVAIDGVPHVALKPICEALGIQWEAQYRRLQRHPVLSKGMSVMDIPSPGGVQQAVCLPLSLLNGWLFGISAARVRPELRERVEAYQHECFDALAQHFGLQAQPTPVPTAPLAPPQLLPAARQKLLQVAQGLPPVQARALLDDPALMQQLAEGYLLWAMQSQRWLVSFDQLGHQHMLPVPHDAAVMTWADVAKRIAAGDVPLRDVSAIAEAAVQRLQELAQQRAVGKPGGTGT